MSKKNLTDAKTVQDHPLFLLAKLGIKNKTEIDALSMYRAQVMTAVFKQPSICNEIHKAYPNYPLD